MTHAPIRNICATTAICAVLALGSTPALAQDVAPPLDVPAASVPAETSAPAQQPTIVLPAEAPAPPVPAPVLAPGPAVAAPEEPARADAPAERRPAARSAASTTRAAPARPAAQPQEIAPQPLPPAASVPLTTPAAAPPPVVTAPPEEAQAAPPAAGDDWLTSPATGFIALLAALGLGAGAYFAARAGRRRREDEYDEAYDAALMPAYDAPLPYIAEPDLPAYAMMDDADPAPERPAQALEPTPHPATAQRIGSEELAAESAPVPEAAPVATPEGAVPTTREGRDALLEAMVSAPPDADNPFTSRKARLRRARIILQTREHQQKQEAATPFDWRTYKPPTSNPAPATPPRVTA